MRYFFEIAYHGGSYHGWQSQPNAIGVQEVVEDGLSKLMGRTIPIVGSGRTDAGVHCSQQFFHADFENSIDAQKLIYRLNSFLPKEIAIHSIRQVKDDAHARFDAAFRRYTYRISRVKNPFEIGQASVFTKSLNIDQMQEAANYLIGERDFESFSKVKTDVNTFICRIFEAEWKENDNLLSFNIKANRFLRGMVRAITGTLLEVGTGKLTPQQFEEIIRCKDRKKAGAAVPAEGLFLVEVNYPEEIFIK